MIKKLSDTVNSLFKNTEVLESLIIEAKNHDNITDRAAFYRNSVFPAMQTLRVIADGLEAETDSKYWPMPSYSEILFSVWQYKNNYSNDAVGQKAYSVFFQIWILYTGVHFKNNARLFFSDNF